MNRFRVLGVALFLLLTLPGCSSGAAQPVPVPEMPARGATVALPDEPEREFDFWVGEWDVQNKHLRGGSWVDSGQAVALIQLVADGGAVLEQWNGALGGNPLIGFSVRAFDPKLGKWVIYLNWHGGRPGGFSPMHGTRTGERIELFPPNDNTKMRYTFSKAREGSCQWDQALSEDGETWVTDWVMQFTRREGPTSADASDFPIVEPPDSASKFPETRKLDFLIGGWTGRANVRLRDGGHDERPAKARISSMIEGFGLLQFIDIGDERTFAALGHDNAAGSWVAIRADSRRAGMQRMTGEPGDGEISFVSGSGDERIRENWSNCTKTGCDWERSLSTDGGESWQTEATIRWTRD